MLPDLTLPPSLIALLATFEPCFTVPTFRTFCALAAGFLAQTGRRTVCGMLTGAGLSRVWRHDRAHRFFSHARWSAEDLGLVLAKLAVMLLVPDGQPVLVAIDDTLFKRTGRKVHAIGRPPVDPPRADRRPGHVPGHGPASGFGVPHQGPAGHRPQRRRRR